MMEDLVATKGERTRERILMEAGGLMEEKGFAGSSVNELLKRCGIKRGSLYFHFPGKEDLEKAVLECAREKFMGFLASSLAGATPGKALENFFTAVFEQHRSKGFAGG
jgi:TetR/AcrR family transcriptional repressor of nem operon